MISVTPKALENDHFSIKRKNSYFKGNKLALGTRAKNSTQELMYAHIFARVFVSSSL